MHLLDSAGNEIGTNDKPVVVAKHKKTTLYGTYYIHSGNLTILASAHGSTAGFMWVFNPLVSGKIIKIVRLDIIADMTTALATPTAPRLTVERITSTTNFSGAIIAVAKGDSTDVTNVAYVTLVSTGATITAGAAIAAAIVPANATGTVNTNPEVYNLIGEKSDVKDLVLRAGEGIVIRQADAGTTSDTRKAVINIVIEEYA